MSYQYCFFTVVSMTVSLKLNNVIKSWPQPNLIHVLHLDRPSNRRAMNQSSTVPDDANINNLLDAQAYKFFKIPQLDKLYKTDNFIVLPGHIFERMYVREKSSEPHQKVKLS